MPSSQPSHFPAHSYDGLHTITYVGADGGQHLACLPPDGNGGLSRLPAHLRPTYHGYGWTSRQRRDGALAYLLELSRSEDEGATHAR